MSSDVQTGTIKTKIPARLDRLPWSRWHWRIIIGLGTVWILDGLEVTIVSSISAQLGMKGSGVNLSSADISGLAASLYVAGSCAGALIFGQLTDRFGRKKLFMITLGVYLVATVCTAFSFTAIWFYAFRFFTGFGIGGEYSAINSAIDELIPAKNRGRVDIGINGSYWFGAGIGSLVALLALNHLAVDVGWRACFGFGFVFGLGILIIRRNVPESPRWLFIHGREEEAERVTADIERQVEADIGTKLEAVPDSEQMTVRQRRTIPLTLIVRSVFTLYPKRSVLGLALFVGQAFLYNSILFGLGTLMTNYFKVSADNTPYYIAIFAVGNLFGPLTLGRLFDSVGRIPMIAGTYLLSGVMLVVVAILFGAQDLTATSFIILLTVLFFFASAGVSGAYLTVSEVFPMETRALCIAVFYAIGTGVGGITGPLLFQALIDKNNFHSAELALIIGAVLMIIGGLAEVFLGVRAEGQSLENIAKPLTVEDAESSSDSGSSSRRGRGGPSPATA